MVLSRFLCFQWVCKENNVLSWTYISLHILWSVTLSWINVCIEDYLNKMQTWMSTLLWTKLVPSESACTLCEKIFKVVYRVSQSRSFIPHLSKLLGCYGSVAGTWCVWEQKSWNFQETEKTFYIIWHVDTVQTLVCCLWIWSEEWLSIWIIC